MYQIEKGHAIPANLDWAPRQKYPFPDMQVGDSFYVGDALADAERVRGAMKSFAKNHSMRFTLRKHDIGYRCWRTA